MRFLIFFLCYFFWGANAQAQNYVDSLRKSYGTDEYETPIIFLWEKTYTYHDCIILPKERIPEEIPPLTYIRDESFFRNVTDSAENVLVKKNNKWGVWNFKKSFFKLGMEYDSILPVNVIAEYDGGFTPDYNYINHFILVLKQNKWYLLDSAFQKKDTIGYDSIYIDHFSNNLIFIQKEFFTIYNPFSNKLFFMYGANFFQRKGYFSSAFIAYNKNKKIGFVNTIDSVYCHPIYTKLVIEQESFFLLKDANAMDFFHLVYKKNICNLQTIIWNVHYWVRQFHELKNNKNEICNYNCFLMLKTINNRYLFFGKKKDSNKYTLKTVPFIDILEPIYLLFISPYYQKIE